MGANEARQVLDMLRDLGDVLGLELYTAAQALDYRNEMLNAARRLAATDGWQALAAKVEHAPPAGHPQRARFEDEARELAAQLAGSAAFHPGRAVLAAHKRLRQSIDFMHRDRPMQDDIAAACGLVREHAFSLD